ncbi:MAG TPA: hypothetical protein VIH93_08245 [Thermoanaerobaculia bacterium]
MHPLLRPALKALISLALVATPGVAAGAAAGRPILVAAAAPGVLELPGGARIGLALPAGSAVAAVEPLAGGWLAAGTRTREDIENGREIFLLAGRSGAVSAAALPPPPAARKLARLRAEPLPLVEDGRLAGLVWLEGSEARRLRVMFARWNGRGWGAPRTVSPPGPGSQLALAAARLADGSWLLAWSAFDGHDDEIVWSRFDGARWSRPARVAPDNDVPDVTPALAAQGDGAWIAWSRFDGDGYRTVTSRFSPAGGGRFSPPLEATPAGAVFPSFEPGVGNPGSAGTWLLTKTSVPAGWSLFELDAQGRAVRRAAVVAAGSTLGGGAGDISGRPSVEAEPGGAGVTFRFPASGALRGAAWESLPAPPASSEAPGQQP